MRQRPPFRERTPAQLREQAEQWRVQAAAVSGNQGARLLRLAELYEVQAAHNDWPPDPAGPVEPHRDSPATLNLGTMGCDGNGRS
jgi:hypothetical protein